MEEEVKTWLDLVSRRCGKSIVDGYSIFSRYVTVCHEMLQARGYVVDNTSVDDCLRRVQQSEPMLFGSKPCGATIVVFTDIEERTGIKKVRQLLEAHATSAFICVSIDGPTPFTRREFINVDEIQFFHLKELIHNVTKHELNPTFTALDDQQQKQVADQYCMKDSDWIQISFSDPIAKYYNWPVGTIVKVERRGLSQDSSIVYRKVVKLMQT